MATILIIDDERPIRSSLRDILEYESYKVLDVDNGIEGLEVLKKEKVDLVLCDIKMNKMDGMEVLDAARGISDTPFIMISGHGTIETAVEAARRGAYDFLEKPLDLNRLLITVRNGLERESLVKETKVLKRKVSKTREILGDSESISLIKDCIDKVAPTDARVLITGANGSGKELVARWLHEKSNRSSSALIEVNCAAIPSELIESELFGHEKGAFTSAVKQRIGKFEQANGGTLFLDEIGDMSLSAQAKVLRALQENKITRVGGDKEITVNVRVIAATNKDLLKEIDAGNFRMDLYHRLSVILIDVPSLGERREDIPQLAMSFCEEICGDYNIPTKEFTTGAMKALQELPWTGNIRELRNMVERLIILSGKVISEPDVSNFANPSVSTHGTNGHHDIPTLNLDSMDNYQAFKEHAEQQFLAHKLKKYNWNVTQTAQAVGLPTVDIQMLMDKYKLKEK
ncbi:sigma-54-dependent Fis family transcriptional regulator [Sphingobacterium sp. SGG-5]|uniref:sigma-54-dependent transcriptional regulator n=1 Tax=Sphingobacterium sp. SGG-5 TaxID=2710881 RepID=UPI0013EBBC1A|nr:sigma-54 dependent transcriptional regulator [Sphingobacterium sp. SGG-5]NGM62203.1 sigma-54-dependent Fis family transcriptional regulator [Sphingobacterium sp. SGG-5]